MYGIEIRDASNNLTFSSSDLTWTLIAVRSSPANTSATHTVPSEGWNKRIVTRLMINQMNGDDEAYLHTYVLQGTQLITTAPSSTDTVETQFMVFGK